MAATDAHPVRTLRDLVTALEAAITLTLAKPKPKPIHHLRTTTRRIEAQLELLCLLPNLPKHAKQAKVARKHLRKLRRAAGRVRDLDVQRDLTEPTSQEAHNLRRLFKRQRGEAAEQLLDAIQQHQSKLVRTLESLLKTLTPTEPLALPLPRLTQLTLHWYTHHIPATAQTSDELHTIRKSAKLARYMAESGNSTAKPVTAAHHLARTFESLQQSGGHWHDWATLSDIALSELGSSSPLTQSFARRCKNSLAAYQRHLKSFQKTISSAPPLTV